MGRVIRENANCGDPVGTLPGNLWGPRTFRRGLIGKIRQNSSIFCFCDFRKIAAKFGQNLAKICQI